MPFSIRQPEDFAGRSQSRATLPQVELEIVRGQARQRVRRVEVPVFLIGTADDCDLVLADPQFPEVHSYLFLSDEGVWVRRIGSEPGLSVEGRLVKAVQLFDGDCLRTGSYEFRIRIRSPRFEQDGDSRSSAGPFAQVVRKERGRTSAALGVVQELLDEIRAEIEYPQRSDVA